jgi:ADP-heptose:LPS heptosyltransferase
MWLIKAPVEKYGIIPEGKHLISEDVKFHGNIALASKFYWTKAHLMNGCHDITPRWMIKARQKRKLINILVIAKGGIGDVLWILPFIKELKVQNEKSTIVVLTDDRALPVFHNFPYIATAVKDQLWNVQGLFDAADEIYDFGGMATVYTNMDKLDPVERPFKMAGLKQPATRKDMRPHIVLTAAEGKDSLKILENNGINIKDRIITIATESSTPNRDWPLSFVYSLSCMLVAEGFKVVLVSAKKEHKDLYFLNCPCGWTAPINIPNLPDKLSFKCPSCKVEQEEDLKLKRANIINLAGQTNLRQYMSIIALSDLFIGPNSSGMVIATALEIPTLGLFGNFKPTNRTKFYDKFFYIKGRSDCDTCEDHWTECPKGHPAPCMRSIFPEVVFDEALRMIKNFPRTGITKKPIDEDI